jgi:hypothetical protein
MNPFIDHDPDFVFKHLFIDDSSGEDVRIPIIDVNELNEKIGLYERRTHRRLRIIKSYHRNGVLAYRKYRCTCHLNCIFRARFRLRRSDNRIILNSATMTHG